MPIIKSAKAKLKKDRKKTKINLAYREGYKKILKELRGAGVKKNVEKLLATAYAKVDKALKKKIITKNKAARLKSQISKFLRKK